MERLKKITLFTAEFPYGFQETFLENEIEYLTKHFNVTVIPLFGSTHIRNFDQIEVLAPVFKGRKLDLFEYLVVFLSISFWSSFFKGIFEKKISPSNVIKLVKQSIIIAGLRKYLNKYQNIFHDDLWYFYWGTNSVNILPFLEKSPKAVARFHRFDLYDVDVDGGTPQYFRKRLFEKLNKISVITQDGISYLHRNFKIEPSKISLNRLGVPDRGQGKMSPDGVFRIVSCSNLYKVKRVELIIGALKNWTGPQLEWTHFGDGPSDIKKKLLELTRDLPSQVSFNFKGQVKNSELMDYYKKSAVDLFLNVSLSEGLPVSIMEALSFGIPVLATNCGGVSELVSDKNGKLLELKINEKSLAKEILNFYNMSYNNKDIRHQSKMSWQELVDSKINYHQFCNELKEL